ncbi:hypothetical protein BCR39DRAFT_162382 [Naematelia encephala]|uniref:F-box domain-containing protein n=1 Tax=Naematelia encephala TaxID=71784 RepID=A0A1Y2B4Z6_9TREE|nr:hypothetical protein BCR39DRAFT_162382 [Naematelia encephala]
MASSKEADESRKPVSSDPLIALGPSLFLQVLSSLPFPDLLSTERVSRPWRNVFQTHRMSIWRKACYRSGLETKYIKDMEVIERAAASAPHWAGEPGEEEIISPDDIPDPVNWKGVCKGYVELQRGWKWGRACERWIAPQGGASWRIKLDPEEGTLLSTSCVAETIGRGLHVLDAKTNQPLFVICAVRPWAHLEFAKGFVIFDVGVEDTPFTVQVYRTQAAIQRSSHPPPKEKTAVALSSQSLTHFSWRPNQDDTTPLPRGHLSFYRTIQPPTACIAFRARVDYEGIEGKERAVLATAGDEAIYIWDLDDEKKVEVIQVPQEHRLRTRYVEFDEDFVFICSSYQVFVYRRSSKTLCASFPRRNGPSISTANETVQDATTVREQEPEYRSPSYFTFQPGDAINIPPRRNIITEYPQATFGYVEATLQDPRTTLLPCIAPSESDIIHAWLNGGDTQIFGFSACHYTTKDLFCTSESGILIVVRDYRNVLNGKSVSAENIDSNSIWINLGEPIRLLSTHGEHAVAVTKEQIYVLDTAHLPTLGNDSDSLTPPTTIESGSSPATPIPTPPPTTTTKIRINSILSVNSGGLDLSSCVQMDRSHIYLTYSSQGETNAGGVIDPETGNIRRAPYFAYAGFGVCIKAWEF